MPHAAIAPPKVSSSSKGSAPAVSAPKAASGSKPSSGDTELPKKILVVDPDSEERARIIRIVNEAADDTYPIAVHEAEDGAAAWALIEVVEPDLVITEILLEGLSGLQLMRRLKERFPEDTPKVFFVTQMSNEVDRYWALRTGATGYVAKPYEDELLHTRARRFFEAKDGRLDLDSNWPLDP